MIMHVGKKIICMKDIPSDLIEEAIFILKPNVTQKENDKFENKTKEIILDEAEYIVEQYAIKLNEKKDEENFKELSKIKREAIYIIALLIFASVVISIII